MVATATARRRPRARSRALQERLGRQAKRRADLAQTKIAPRYAARLAGAFRDFGERLERRLGQRGPIPERKDWDDDVWAEEPFLENAVDDVVASLTEPLSAILRSETILITEEAYRAASETVGAQIRFDLNSRDTKAALADVGWKIKDLTNESRASLRGIIRTGIDDGVHPSVIARRLIDAGMGWGGGPRGDQVAHSRAYVIARTETAMVFNKGAVSAYRTSGLVEKVECLDGATCGWRGHNDPERANGKVVTLDVAQRNLVSHPNCVRAYAPLVSGTDEEPLAEASPWADPKDFGSTTRYGTYGDSEMETWSHGIYTEREALGIQHAQRVALSDYQGTGYHDINARLRGVRGPGDRSAAEARESAEMIRSYIGAARTPDPVVVYRGVGSGRQFTGVDAFDSAGWTREEWASAMEQSVGQTFTEKGFMSTALAEGAQFPGVRLRLTVPKGYPALPINNAATTIGSFAPAAMSEAELLLQAGARYVIDSYELVEFGNGFTATLIGRVLPQ